MNIPDIEALPLLDSSARSPKFQYRYTVNTPRQGITGEAMLLLRIYTLDVNSGELIVFGNSIIRVFIKKENDEVCTMNFDLLLCPETLLGNGQYLIETLLHLLKGCNIV